LVDQIIKQLQASSLPERDGRLLLGFPNVVQPRITGDLIHYKPCVIDAVAVNYSPTGNPSFYTNRDNGSNKLYSTDIEITIGLKELEIVTADDPRFASIAKGNEIADINANPEAKVGSDG
jgi:GTP:adenosylcobinamide-phosphate guanylyltransferase